MGKKTYFYSPRTSESIECLVEFNEDGICDGYYLRQHDKWDYFPSKSTKNDFVKLTEITEDKFKANLFLDAL
jgi:hypothetical protein